MTEPTPEPTPEPEKPKTMGWHFHRWTLWGQKYTHRGTGMVGAVGNPDPLWYQERRCTQCNAIQERLVGLD